MVSPVSSYQRGLLMLLLAAVLTNIIHVSREDCPSTYPEICWDPLSLPAPTDPDSETQPAGSLPQLIRHSIAFIAPSSFYVFGGLDPSSNKLKKDLWRIRASPPGPPTTNTWTVQSVSLLNADPPVGMKARMDHSMVAYRQNNGQYALYIYAGLGDVRLKDLWRFNVDNFNWYELGSPAGNSVGYRFGHTAVMITDLEQSGLDWQSSRMWVFGGTDQVNVVRDDLHIYEFPSDNLITDDSAWTMSVPLDPKPAAVTQHCAAQVHDFCMYVQGGVSSYSPFQATSQIWEYCSSNPSDGTWVNPRPTGWTEYLPEDEGISPTGRLTRYSHACTRADDRLLIFGGRPNIGQPNYGSDLIDYDPVLNRWGDVKQGVMFENDAALDGSPSGREEMAYTSFSFDGEYYLLFHGGKASGSSTFTDMWSINYRRPQCEAGYYSSTGTIDCEPCPAGAVSLNGSYTCTNCTAGQYTQGEGDYMCRDCPAGTYTVDGPVGGIDECIPCSAGTASNITGRDTVCDPCPVGTYSSNTTGRAFCFDCPGGTANSNTGSILESDCIECSPGFYALNGSETCSPCNGGYYSENSRQRLCDICPAGTWSDPQATQCEDCPIGTSNNAPGSSGSASCVDCRAGTYAPAPATPYCIECQTGTFSPTIGAIDESTCQDCPLGTFSNITGAPSINNCTGCPPGTYQNSQGSDSCLLCPSGTYNEAISSTGIDDCKDCPAGTYAPNEGTPSFDLCLSCEIGQYQPLEGQDFCRFCPNGTYNPNTRVDAISGCLPCPPDTFSYAGQPNCTGCGNTPRSGIPASDYEAGARPSYSMAGWEKCQSCTNDDEYSYGWIKNGHFEGDPIHNLWSESASASAGCTYSISNGYLSVTSDSNSRICIYSQSFDPLTESSFPFYMSASARNGNLQFGTNPVYRAEFTIHLQNGTQQVFELDVTENPQNTWKTVTEYHRPFQVTDRRYIEDLYIITQVDIDLVFQNIQGTVEWDDIMFSPNDTKMCQCSKINRESEFFNIDLFNRDTCDRCTIGKYCNGAGQFQCPDDTYSFGGYTACLECTKGLACKDGIATTCNATQFKNVTSNQCEECPLDSGCRNTDRFICLPGTYGQGLRHCIPCEPGTYCDENGCTSCEACPPGTTSNYLRTYCYDCPVGHYSPDGSSCMSCPDNTYADEVGSSGCISCPDGTNTTCTGASDIFFCK